MSFSLVNQRITEAYLAIYESAEDKNRRRAQKFADEWLRQHGWIGKIEAVSANGTKLRDGAAIEHETGKSVENARQLANAKYMTGAVRMYLELQMDPSTRNEAGRDLGKLNQIVKIIATDPNHLNEYDANFNGLSFVELDRKFATAVAGDLKKDMEEMGSKTYSRNERYDIVKISSFEEASKYSRYTSWCVTHGKAAWDSYTHGNMGIFYFCLVKGFEDVPKRVGEGCPLDEYGRSMIAISVNDDGSLNTCTCRWNHDNGGSDHLMTTKEISEFFGVNFYETFKPRSAEELIVAYRKNAVVDEFAERMGWIAVRNPRAASFGMNIIDYIIIGDDNRIVKMRKCYEAGDVVCVALDHFFWYSKDNGTRIEAPRSVDGVFSCTDCTSLTSLEGAPREVGGRFHCDRCTSLTSLEGAPQKVGSDFWCSGCTSLTSLEGVPRSVGGDFYCNNCTSLTSLEGAPQEVGGDFSCSICTSLTSLEGAPQSVGGDFYCNECTSLTSLEGAPQSVGGNFYCIGCTSLKKQ